MTYRIMKTKYCILKILYKMGGGGVRLYFMWFPGGSLDLSFVRRGGGGHPQLDDGSKFQPAPSDT